MGEGMLCTVECEVYSSGWIQEDSNRDEMNNPKVSNLVRKIEKVPFLWDLVHFFRGTRKPIFIDYKPDPVPRYGYGKAPHTGLYAIINKNRHQYKNLLSQFLQYKQEYIKIPLYANHADAPYWIYGFLSGLDSVALYNFLVLYKPNSYIEVGSGNSTKFVRRAILDHNLQTRVTSIDPSPRSKVDNLCHELIRKPLEEVNLALFDELHSGDILFIDNSHRAFTNSDVTVLFLDIIPRLNKGVFVHLHDIYLPYDYPPSVARQWYSEQYLLACYLLAGEPQMFDIVLPNMFISKDDELMNQLLPLWEMPEMQGVERHGVSFWIQIQSTYMK